VLSQTDKDFRWIGIVHNETPRWVLDRLKQTSKLELAVVEYDVEAAVRGVPSINLDTDDAIARDFVAQAKKIKPVGQTVFLRGLRYRLKTDVVISTRSKASHFNLVNHSDKTVLDFPHVSPPMEHRVVDLKRPMWLEIIHERNICNKLNRTKRCKRFSQEFVSKYFEIGGSISE
jgi:hypothetical protein